MMLWWGPEVVLDLIVLLRLVGVCTVGAVVMLVKLQTDSGPWERMEVAIVEELVVWECKVGRCV